VGIHREKIKVGLNCFTGKPIAYKRKNKKILWQHKTRRSGDDYPYIGPGLIDLQVNGIHGIDFNNASLTGKDVVDATHTMLTFGVTTYFPALITNDYNVTIAILKTIKRVCALHELTGACIGGIHLEGPFISPHDGARGAHDKKYTRNPDVQLIEKFQEASEGMIKIITLAPELEGIAELIRYCRKNNIVVAIGHSNANVSQIEAAVKAGARLSTHLGNAAPLMLPRHSNLLWDQLAQNKLFASIIADGFHLSDSFIKVVIKVKRNKTILVSDVTAFSGMPPGKYRTHIGQKVVLTENGKLYLENEPQFLAGASKSLFDNIKYLLSRGIVNLGQAWRMASINPAHLIYGRSSYSHIWPNNDLVTFNANEQEITISEVIKNGKIVFIR